MKKYLLFISLICLTFLRIEAQVVTSNGSGNWNTPGIWSTNTVPGIGDSVVIQNTHLIVLDMPVSGVNNIKSLLIQNGGALHFRNNANSTLQLSNTLMLNTGAIFRADSNLTASGHLLQVGGNITCNGTLNMRAFKLRAGGSITGTGSLIADSVLSVLETFGSGTQNITTTLFSSGRLNAALIYNNVAFFGNINITSEARFINGSVTSGGTITLGLGGTNNFIYERAAGTHPTITRNYGTGSNTITYSGSNLINTGSELPSNFVGNLIVNSTSGVTLTAAISVRQLTMQNGQLVTTSSNILTISDTSRYAVTRTGGWVNGPMIRTLYSGWNSVDASRVYLFPVGKSSYAGFEIVTPVTRYDWTFSCPVPMPILVKVESFDGATGGGGSQFSFLKNNRYWNYTLTSGSCAFFSSGIRVYDSTTADTIAMGVSSSLTGTYNNIGGFYNNNTIGGTQPIYPSFYGNSIYITLGGKPTLAGGTYTVGATGHNYKSITEVSNLLHSRIVTGNLIFEFYDNYSYTNEIIPFTFWPFAKRGGNWNVVLRPNINNTDTLRTYGNPSDANSKAYFFSLFTFLGSSNITIDGRKGGVGNNISWIFRNTTTTETAPVFRFQDDATRDTIQYVQIEGQVINSYGLVDFYQTSYANGNDSNAVRYCYLRRRSDNFANVNFGIYSNYTTSGPRNDYNTIEGNYIENMNNRSLYLSGSMVGDGWNIRGNHFFSTIPNATATIFEFSPSSTTANCNISGNYFGGNAPFAAGQWVNSAACTFMRLTADPNQQLVVSGNIIKNIRQNTGAFTGINLTSGNFLTFGNQIGDPGNDSSILLVAAGTHTGIYMDAASKGIVSSNAISGIYNRANGSGNAVYGIRSISTTAPTIYNNSIKKLGIYMPTSISNTPSLFGIHHFAGSIQNGIQIRLNTISDLTIIQDSAVNSILRAVYINPAATSSGSITRNQIYNLTNSSNGASAEISGLYLDEGSWVVSNNQVSVSNGNRTNDLIVNGIIDATANGAANNYWNNSVYIGGTVLGTKNSSAFRRTVQATMNLRNNLLYNQRSGGSGAHVAIYNNNSSPTSGWSSTASMHNLLVVNDTTKVAIWNATNNSNNTYRKSSSGDSTSWIYLVSDLPADSLFINKSSNLNIQNNRSFCYAVNGKGRQTSVTEDFSDSAANRSTTLIGGAPDIGADEIAPANGVFPPQLTITGSHSPGGTETFWQGGRRVAELVWANSGTLPTLSRYVYFTGVWPNDTTNGGRPGQKRFINAWLRFDTSNISAGSGYRYSLRYFYDDALLGNLSNEGILLFCKKHVNVGGSWDSIQNPSIDFVKNIIFASSAKFNSFSEFTLSENSSQVLPVIFTGLWRQPGYIVFEVANDRIASDYHVYIQNDSGIADLGQLPAEGHSGSRKYLFPFDGQWGQSYCVLVKAMVNQESVDQISGLCENRESSLNHSISIFPNPANDKIYISIPAEGNYMITDIYGSIIQSGKLIKGTQAISVSEWSSGNYILKTNSEGRIRTGIFSVIR